jgi:hypothetical protein
MKVVDSVKRMQFAERVKKKRTTNSAGERNFNIGSVNAAAGSLQVARRRVRFLVTPVQQAQLQKAEQLVRSVYATLADKYYRKSKLWGR